MLNQNTSRENAEFVSQLIAEQHAEIVRTATIYLKKMKVPKFDQDDILQNTWIDFVRLFERKTVDDARMFFAALARFRFKTWAQKRSKWNKRHTTLDRYIE
jgi:DNA-directed RNA polymerase specialized sigma24 family protein